jgi:hypothetical protein
VGLVVSGALARTLAMTAGEVDRLELLEQLLDGWRFGTIRT